MFPVFMPPEHNHDLAHHKTIVDRETITKQLRMRNLLQIHKNMTICKINLHDFCFRTVDHFTDPLQMKFTINNLGVGSNTKIINVRINYIQKVRQK